ncbi:MAG: 50S ribosomal protein L10 [Oscillospiraceae bacterium]|nr:50S ribosomal protein L10 [Oscillospiraceae bacterium]
MPSAKVLTEKQGVVAALKERIDGAQAGVLVDYKGINVADDTALRRKLREAGVEYNVVKNTLLNFAVQGTDLAELSAVLSGTTALATSTTDAVAPAKVLKEYAVKTKDAFSIKAGFVEGKPLDAAGVKQLADMPSREELMAKLLGSVNSPASGLANVVQANMRGLAVVIQAIAEQKSA